jgi:hypothetical protein
MQTFLPFEDFARCAEVLDDRRLGKQRVETLQVLRALHVEGYGWASHPAVLMWRGYAPALVGYGLAVVDEWGARGYADSVRDQIAEFSHPVGPRSQAQLGNAGELPPWLGCEALHRSHRSALLGKDPGHYRPRVPPTPDDLPYVWPDPPTPAPAPERRDAWAVRGAGDGDRLALVARDGEIPWTPLARRTGRVLKRQRQVARFVESMQLGDVVATPVGAEVRIGLVAGKYQAVSERHVRPVRWIACVRRADLCFPARLQDPQDVFAITDEPILRSYGVR